MKKIKSYSIAMLLLLVCQNAFAQRDILFKKDSTQVRCKILQTKSTAYVYAFVDDALQVRKVKIAKTLVDSVKLNVYDSNLVQHKWFANVEPPIVAQSNEAQKPWQFNVAWGLNLGNILEFNNPSGSDKKSFSATTSIDLGLNYQKEGKRFSMTNELHWIFGLQKSGLTSGDYFQPTTDDLNTLHDFSFAIGKNRKWNFNIIARTSTSIVTIFEGDYFSDINNLGKTKGFLSPYDVTISPGIKYQPNNYLRISISPYSFNLYGVRNQEVTNKGLYITDMDASGNFKNYLFKRLGAEINFWYDRNVKDWLQMQYRLSISSSYFEKLADNGLLSGLFITRFKIFKDLYLTHRGELRGDFALSPFKPYYNQSILISYAKSF
jgi:hypothetical protein